MEIERLRDHTTRTAVQDAVDRVQSIPVTDTTQSLRARALQALWELEDALEPLRDALEPPLRERGGEST